MLMAGNKFKEYGYSEKVLKESLIHVYSTLFFYISSLISEKKNMVLTHNENSLKD